MNFKKRIIFLVLATFYAIQVVLPKPKVSITWNVFKNLHRKQFATPEEESFRRKIFQKKLKLIEKHNQRFQRGIETYEIGVNQFSDYTEKELLPYTNSLHIPLHKSTNVSNVCSNFFSSIKLPDSFDWRDQGKVTPVKTQSGCGSCWAFAATGAIESHYKIYYNTTVILSEQQLIDCVPEASGCTGGWMVDAYTYITKSGGINFSQDYPYEDKENTCRFNVLKPKVNIRGYEFLNVADEEVLKYVVATRGPVSVAIHGEGRFAYYKRGVYYNPLCIENRFTHAGVVVGYGTENQQDYWLLKNSWGPQWGLDGYIKMARNRNNHCGIVSKASFPVL